MRTLTDQLLFGAQLPLSLAYSKSSFTMAEDAGAWEILQTAIGQGSTQMTPIHNAMITAAIANGGVLMKPYLMDHVENAAGEEVEKFLPSSYGSLITAEEAGLLTDLMRRVVTEGTGSAVRTDAYTVASNLSAVLPLSLIHILYRGTYPNSSGPAERKSLRERNISRHRTADMC